MQRRRQRKKEKAERREAQKHGICVLVTRHVIILYGSNPTLHHHDCERWNQVDTTTMIVDAQFYPVPLLSAVDPTIQQQHDGRPYIRNSSAIATTIPTLCVCEPDLGFGLCLSLLAPKCGLCCTRLRRRAAAGSFRGTRPPTVMVRRVAVLYAKLLVTLSTLVGPSGREGH